MSSNNLNLRQILTDNKLNGANFLDWHRSLGIVLKQEKIGYILEGHIPLAPGDEMGEAKIDAYAKHLRDDEVATCVMLASMTLELQKQHEYMDTYTMITNLKELFDEQSRTEIYEISKELFRCKMTEGSSVNTHVLKMIGYTEKLRQLGFAMIPELSVDCILQSLPDSYSQFVMNFNMNKLSTILPELLNMLKTAESSIKRERRQVMLVNSSKAKKKSIKSFKKAIDNL